MDDEIKIVRQAISEVLKEFSDLAEGLVLCGGWVPQVVCKIDAEPHRGTVDIDLALSSSIKVGIKKRLEKMGFTQKIDPVSGNKILYKHTKTVYSGRKPFVIDLDLLTEASSGAGSDFRLVKVGDVYAFSTTGLELGIANSVQVTWELGKTPDSKLSLRVPNAMAFLVLKAYALNDPRREDPSKDAYDIFYVAKYYEGGRSKIAEEFRSVSPNEHITRTLTILKENFGSIDSRAVVFVAKDRETEVGGYEQAARDVYETMADLLSLIDKALNEQTQSIK